MAAGAPTRKPKAPAGGARAAKMAGVQLWLGFAITAVIAVAQSLGWTRRLEYPLYDLRARVFNYFTPPPSDKVAVIAIDDGSIETVGKWPWPRELLGEAIRELKRGGASVVALDLLHDDPQSLVYLPDPEHPGSLISIDNDALLGAGMAAHGSVVQGSGFNYIDPTEAAKLQAEQRGRGINRVRFDEVYDAIADTPGISDMELLEELVPGTPTIGPEMADLRRKRSQVETLRAAQITSSLPVPNEVARWPYSNAPSPPVPVIAHGAAALASVSFGDGDPDGGVRRIPLWVQVQSRLYPTLGVAAAALHLGIDLQRVGAGVDHTDLVFLDGRRISIPTHAATLKKLSTQGDISGLLHVCWPRGGSGGWKRQFAVEVEKGHFEQSELPLGRLLDPSRNIIPALRKNIAELDAAVASLSRNFGLGDPASYEPRAKELATLTPDDPRWRELHAQQKAAWLKIIKESEDLLQAAVDPSIDPATLTPEERAAIQDLENAAKHALPTVKEIDAGIAGLDKWWNEDLPARVKGRICFIGWTATGAAADFVRTSIDPRTPGVLLHAAVANAILNSVDQPQFLSSAPDWINLAAVLTLGILGTIIGVRLGVVESPIVLLAALAAWFALDGVVFWDWRNLFVAEAAPMGAAALGWLSVILHRLLVEQRSRKQTEARFRSYVSPDVVDILVNNPEMDSMRPQKRELTIFFSDIAGWTTITERIGTEGIAAFLATYLKAMTDILQDNRATIDKYLGDGIMAFWGAPIEDADHAKHAVEAVILMQEKLRQMNDAGEFGPAGKIGVRIGLASGEVNVGDFGNPPHKSAYTVIGDTANLAARLESANKQFGSKILMTERTRELARMTSAFRLIGRVVVKGKTEPETLYEPIGGMMPKGNRTPEWIILSNDAVGAYIAGDFDKALDLFDRLEEEFGDHELAEKYRESIAQVRAEGGPGADFKGTIVLSEK